MRGFRILLKDYKRMTALVLLFCFAFSLTVKAESDSDLRVNEKVLVVYSNENGEISENQNLLDLLLSHFFKGIAFKNANNFVPEDLDDVSTLIYYGETVDVLPDSVAEKFNEFSGTILAIGHNSEQLGPKFSFIKHKQQVAINELIIVKGQVKRQLEGTRLISEISPSSDPEVIITGAGNGKTYPLFLRKGANYYFASDKIDSLFSIYLGEVLHEVFEAPHSPGHPAYIRLEDVHPLTDHNTLKQIAIILEKKKIPYIVSVIPVYRDPETGAESRFSDYPEMLNVLKFMEKNGGSIIMHGYTHQYKDDETGEGFEFWDVDANMPITVPAGEKPVKKNRNDFNNDEEYLQFLAKQKEFETSYINTKVKKAIQEMVSLGLHPLAFEAPHYTMSQSGYEILSEHFSTYIGQLQLGDRDWRIMAASPYVSYPGFLHGMKLLPETIGYVEPENPEAIDQMMKAAENIQVVRDGYIAGFFHPYLGVEKFTELIQRMEILPNLNWIDLKKMNNYVAVDHLTLTAGVQKDVDVSVDYFGMLTSTPGFFKPQVKSATNNTLWFFAALSAIMVILFIFYAIRINIKNYKYIGGRYDG